LPYAGVGVAVIVAMMVWLAPEPAKTTPAAAADAVDASVGGAIGYATLQPILAQRCYLCHGAQVQMKNVRLDSAGNVKLHAQNIYQQVVVSKIMPMTNTTGISEAERMVIKQWFESGAKTD
jgi:uncharacterized membrane protein